MADKGNILLYQIFKTLRKPYTLQNVIFGNFPIGERMVEIE